MKHRRILAALVCLLLLLGQYERPVSAATLVPQRQVEEELQTLKQTYVGKTYTDSFYGATQCKGFADMIYDALFHVGTIGAYPDGVYYYMNYVNASTQEVGRVNPGYLSADAQILQPLLEQACPGDYIQMRRRARNYGHSMIVLEKHADGLTVLHCNWHGDLVCSVERFTWSDFSLVSDGISLYHYRNYQLTGSFADVAQDAWYYDYIRTVYGQGIMTGVSETHFEPDAPMTRAMVVSVLYRMSQDNSSYTPSFTDVPDGIWYADAVGWAQTYNLAAGFADGSFHPDEEITREQFAAFLYRFAIFEGKETEHGSNLGVFADVSQVSLWATPSLQWTVAMGIISGTPSGYLHPQASATRAEAATILAQYIALFRTVT